MSSPYNDVDVDTIIAYLAEKHGYTEKQIKTAVYSQFGCVKHTMESASKLLGIADDVRLPYMGVFKVKSRTLNKYKRLEVLKRQKEEKRIERHKRQRKEFIPKYMQKELTTLRIKLDQVFRTMEIYPLDEGDYGAYYVAALKPLRLAKGWLGETLKIINPQGNPYTESSKARAEGKSTDIAPEADVSEPFELPSDPTEAIDGLRAVLSRGASKIQELHGLVVENDLDFSPFIYTAIEQCWVNITEARMFLGYALGAIRDEQNN